MNIINKKTAIFAPQFKDVYHDYKRKQLSYIGYKNYK